VRFESVDGGDERIAASRVVVEQVERRTGGSEKDSVAWAR
jgi:hypothetical protein